MLTWWWNPNPCLCTRGSGWSSFSSLRLLLGSVGRRSSTLYGVEPGQANCLQKSAQAGKPIMVGRLRNVDGRTRIWWSFKLGVDDSTKRRGWFHDVEWRSYSASSPHVCWRVASKRKWRLKAGNLPFLDFTAAIIAKARFPNTLATEFVKTAEC